MKTVFRRLNTSLALVALLGLAPVNAREMSKEEILKEAESLALFQFDQMNWNFWARFWMDGIFWTGVADLAGVSENPKVMQALNKMGDRTSGSAEEPVAKWSFMYHVKKEPHHADDMAIGEAFLTVYEKTKNPICIEDTQRRLDEASASILSPERAEKAAKASELHWQEGLTWYWCDALIMAAPLHARMSAVTGNPKYLEAMHVEWQRASDLLYDKEEHLYFRDKNYITKPTKNGKKTFWSRGNGWVMGALARTIPYIPKDDPKRAWYVNQFKAMSAKLASIQRPDGTWSPSLLDYEQFPYSEMSGTALNCFAMAWGINNGILDDKTYRPIVEKAWSAVLSSRKANQYGYIGYVQGIGAEPAKVHPDQATWYGNGAFLMAAVQMMKMAPINVPELPPLVGIERPPKK